MAEGKLLVLGTILKLDRPFRPPHIGEMTGLDRQLIAYHLRTFTERGYLEKQGKEYIIRNKEALLNSLLESAEGVQTAKMKSRGFFSPETTAKFNQQVESIVAGRTLDLPMSQAAKDGMLQKIDESIAELKNLRKYVTNSTKTVGSAIKFFKQEDDTIDYVWQVYIQFNHLRPLDLPEFIDAVNAAMELDDE
jgi:hypothetical protein